jgi:hypothetical protein
MKNGVFVGFSHILTECTVQEAKSPVKISSGSVARRDLISGLKGETRLLNANVGRVHWMGFENMSVGKLC